MSENEINKSFVNLPKADETKPVHDEPNETVTGASRLSEFEEAIKEASYMLKDALDERGWLKEDELQQLYAARIEDVLNLLRGAKMNTWRQTSRHFVSLPDAYAQKCVIQDLVCGISVKPDIDDDPCDKFHRRFVGELFCNGERIFTMYAKCGKEKTRRICLRAMDGFINQRMKRRRQNERKRAAKEAK